MSFALSSNQKSLRVNNSRPSFQQPLETNQKFILKPQSKGQQQIQSSPQCLPLEDISIDFLRTEPPPPQPYVPQNSDFPEQDLNYLSRFTDTTISPDNNVLHEPRQGFYGESIYSPVHEIDQLIRKKVYGIYDDPKLPIRTMQVETSPQKSSVKRKKSPIGQKTLKLAIPSHPTTPDLSVQGTPKSINSLNASASIPAPHNLQKFQTNSIKLQSTSSRQSSNFTVQNFNQVEAKFAEIYQAEHIILLIRKERLQRQNTAPAIIHAVKEQILQKISMNHQIQAQKQVIQTQLPIVNQLQEGISEVHHKIDTLPLSYLTDKLASICDVIQLKFAGNLQQIRAVPIEKLGEVLDQIKQKYDLIQDKISVQKSEAGTRIEKIGEVFQHCQDLQYQLSSLLDK